MFKQNSFTGWEHGADGISGPSIRNGEYSSYLMNRGAGCHQGRCWKSGIELFWWRGAHTPFHTVAPVASCGLWAVGCEAVALAHSWGSLQVCTRSGAARSRQGHPGRSLQVRVPCFVWSTDVGICLLLLGLLYSSIRITRVLLLLISEKSGGWKFKVFVKTVKNTYKS